MRVREVGRRPPLCGYGTNHLAEAGEEQFEEIVERLDIDTALDHGCAQCVLEVAPALDARKLGGLKGLEHLGRRHPDAVLAQNAGELENTLLHGNSGAGAPSVQQVLVACRLRGWG